jgi:hypothetical protein
VQRINTEEIRSNPGGNFDISKVVQTLPGVGGGGTGGTAAFRNDIVIRGGAPNENVYYLDGIEVPVINHFQTQGSSGGPQGMLNVSFLEDVTLSTSAFNARYDNALSSVLQFRQRDGNAERVQGNLRTSASEVAATLEGPPGPPRHQRHGPHHVSAFGPALVPAAAFEAIDLPIGPSYWDFQFKTPPAWGRKPRSPRWASAPSTSFGWACPRNATPENEQELRQNPTTTVELHAGVNLRQLVRQGFLNVALSRTQLDNQLDQFQAGRKATKAGGCCSRVRATPKTSCAPT